MVKEKIKGQETAEKSRRKQLAEFITTNRTFVLVTGKKKLRLAQKRKIVELASTMPLDERLAFFFDNFESIFVNLFPDDVGYFAYLPSTEEEFRALERDLQRIHGS